MAVGSNQVAVTSSRVVIASGPPISNSGAVGSVWLIPDAANEVYIGGPNVATTNGFKILHGTTPFGPVPLYAGDVLYAVTATTATLGVLQT